MDIKKIQSKDQQAEPLKATTKQTLFGQAAASCQSCSRPNGPEVQLRAPGLRFSFEELRSGK